MPYHRVAPAFAYLQLSNYLFFLTAPYNLGVEGGKALNKPWEALGIFYSIPIYNPFYTKKSLYFND